MDAAEIEASEKQKRRLKDFLFSIVSPMKETKPPRVTHSQAQQLLAATREALDPSLPELSHQRVYAKDVRKRTKQLKAYHDYANADRSSSLQPGGDGAQSPDGGGETPEASFARDSFFAPPSFSLSQSRRSLFSFFDDDSRHGSMIDPPTDKGTAMGLLPGVYERLRACGRTYSTRREDYVSARHFELAQESEERTICEMFPGLKQRESLFFGFGRHQTHCRSRFGGRVSIVKLGVNDGFTRSSFSQHNSPPMLRKLSAIEADKGGDTTSPAPVTTTSDEATTRLHSLNVAKMRQRMPSTVSQLSVSTNDGPPPLHGATGIFRCPISHPGGNVEVSQRTCTVMARRPSNKLLRIARKHEGGRRPSFFNRYSAYVEEERLPQRAGSASPWIDDLRPQQHHVLSKGHAALAAAVRTVQKRVAQFTAVSPDTRVDLATGGVLIGRRCATPAAPAVHAARRAQTALGQGNHVK